ncbi:hypothetical protein MWT96_20495 [Prescottella equi]|uniref:Uncharacterized protein n=1 Tax=Rhodococcus hoagii TaxID=43767 RepID=A0A9Q2PKZ4_RHOHA|nr:hypothetical protein [Prescottella equi]MBM4487406.1 hypothetical protein [Prescottella equi]MBM4497594.1 hypothetical protein [Prescottella equi]MBM4508872.1 hypothetical protein [Prescottella equi]MBM4549327.1 hypothetical protein [Prescottella equi]MBM4567477.1 hypothetical protein [Prescottella equi]
MSAKQDPQVQAAKLAYHRATAVLHTAKANRIEADLKAAEDARYRELAKAMRREAKRMKRCPEVAHFR